MRPPSSLANDTQSSPTPLTPTTTATPQRHNYGSLTLSTQQAAAAAAAVRARGSNNAPSPGSSLKAKSRQLQDGGLFSGTGTGTGTGTGVGDGSGPPGLGYRTTATSHRSVHINVPDDVDEGEGEDRDGDADNGSISSRSSYSTYSSSTSSLQGLDHKGGGGCDGEEDGEGEEASSRRMFWTYVALAPVLLSILGLFAVLLQFLPARESEYIIHWDRFGEGVIGWTIAFAARTPLFALFSKFLSPHHLEDPYLCEWSTLLSAGALEEVVRLVLITLLGIRKDFGAVYWLGLGWAGIETMYYIGQSLVYTRWFSDDEHRAVANSNSNTNTNADATVTTSLLAPALPSNTASTSNSGPQPQSSLESNGYITGRVTSPQPQPSKRLSDPEEEIVPTREARHLLGLDRPWWSLMGRTSSMMVHIGLCCWLGHSDWRLLLPAAAIHGSLYVIWGVLMPEQWSVPATSYGTWIASLGVFLIGLALYGQIV